MKMVGAWIVGAWTLLLPGTAAADPIFTPMITAALVSAGASAATAATIAAVASAVITTALSIGLMYALTPRPKAPEPADGTIPIQEPIPHVIYAVGRCRLAGKTMVWESSRDGILFRVSALKDGRSDAFERFWVNDDEVQVEQGAGVEPRPVAVLDTFTDGRYHDYGYSNPAQRHRVLLWHHTGGPLPASGPTSDNPAQWMIDVGPSVFTNEFRPDGVTALGWVAYPVAAKHQQQVYPNGAPIMSASGRWSLVWDPRDPDQDPQDENTWRYSANPALIRIWYECWCPHGPRRDYQAAVLPRVTRWVEEANACDDLIPQNAGGTAPRYQCGFWFDAATTRDSVRAMIQAACDGWDCEFGDGSFIMVVGKFRPPTVTLTDDDICGYTLDDDENDSEFINHLSIQFTSPDHEFGAVSADPWRDDASILDYGERSESLDLWQVQNLSQARRLAKRVVDRTHAGVRGSLTTTLASLRIVGQRWVRVQSDRVAKLSDVIVEVQGQRTSLAQMRRKIEIRSVNPNEIDAWEPAWEGQAPPPSARVETDAKPAITGLAAVPETIEIGAGVLGIAIDLQWDDFGGSDIWSYEIRYRVAGAPWESTSLASVSYGGGLIQARVQPVEAGVAYEFQARVTGGIWSASAFASTSTDGIAPASPEDLDATSDGSSAHITWRAPTSPNFADATVRRAASGAGFGSSSVVAAGLAGPLGGGMELIDAGLAAGDYDYWVTAENSAGTSSTPAGPVTITII